MARRFLDHAASFLKNRLPNAVDDWLYVDKALVRAEAVSEAFMALGPEAISTLGEPARLATSSTNDPNRLVAIRAIHSSPWLGKPALPPMLNLLTNESLLVRGLAAGSIGMMETNALPAIPALTRSLNDPNEWVVRLATTSLGRLRLRPELVVPVLATNLEKAEPGRLRARTAHALVEFGAQAAPAIPALTKALSDPSDDVRWAATNALQRIAPGTLTSTPLQ